jgi:hypothetical protein
MKRHIPPPSRERRTLSPSPARWLRRFLGGVGLALTSLAALPNGARAASKDFTFTLPSARTTSAGIYQADGTLVRTLWNAKPLPAGSNTAVWDGRDDLGNPMPAGDYKVKVIHHNASYTWQGVIANTSDSLDTGLHRGFTTYQDSVVAGTKMYLSKGYSEGQGPWVRVDTATPNTVAYTCTHKDQSRSFTHMATDGTRVYMANVGTGWSTNWQSFVVAFNVADDTQTTFSAGTSVVAAGGGSTNWSNVLDLEEGQANGPSGIAVQPGGNYLFVAHKNLNEIRVFDKITGTAVTSFAVTAPGRMACTGDNAGLWAICTEGGARVIRRFEIDSGGNLTLGPVITALTDPLSLAVSPNNATVTVADGVTNQLHGYANVSSGTPTVQWTLGTAGGYSAANGPNVTNTKFFMIDPEGGFRTYVTYQPDGSLWLSDPGNNRYLHFSSARAYVGQIAFLRRNYASTICIGDHTRVFAQGWLEYAVPTYSDNAKNDWTLVRNWMAGLPEGFTHGGTSSGLGAVVKLSNGRVYGTARNDDTGMREVLELTATGIRQTGTHLDGGNMHEDGSIRRVGPTDYNSTVYTSPLTGFDGDGNPLWGAETVLASTLNLSTDPRGSSGQRGPTGAHMPSTSTNLVLLSDGRGTDFNTFHLGAIAHGGTKWLWRAAPTAYYFGTGIVGNGSYPVNNSVTTGRHILLGCHGEFYVPPYRGTGQANQFMHFWDNGLLIGQFGNDLSSGNIEGRTGGNAFTPTIVRVGNALYVWHNDEGARSGMHRWKITNPDSLTEITQDITLGSGGGHGTGMTGQYFVGANFETLAVTRTDKTVDNRWSGSPGTGLPSNGYSIRWSGLVEPEFSENYTFYIFTDVGRVWLNDTVIIEDWAPHGPSEVASLPIALTAGQKYSIRIETYDTSGDGGARFRWSSASTPKATVPYERMYPSDAYAVNWSGVAVGRFRADHVTLDPTWTRNQTYYPSTTSVIDTSGVYDPAPMAVYQDSRQHYQMGYILNLTPRTNYKLRLHLAEIISSQMGVGNRTFNFQINGYPILPAPYIDPYVLAGNVGRKASVKEYVVTSDNGGTVRFTMNNEGGPALIAGYEVTRDTSDASVTPSFAYAGAGRGLKAEYFNGTSFNTLVHTRIEPEINYNWSGVSPAPGLGTENYSVRWTGKLQTMRPGDYTFTMPVTSGDGARMWVNGTQVFSRWTSGSSSGVINLPGSTQVDVVIEYKQITGGASVRLVWDGPSAGGTIPSPQLYPAP